MAPTLFFFRSTLAYSIIHILIFQIRSCYSEFTVVLPDSSALVDEPETGLSDHARTDPDEQRAVYAVMEATGNGWATSIPDVCRGRWHGIECKPDKDGVFHVVSLAFGALSDDTAFPTCDPARSSLSPALLALPHLRSLFFYRCFPANPQPIPAFLGRLGASLRSLVLRENGHVGPVPFELGNLTSLLVLDLHGNNLTSPIPSSLQRLTHLQLFDLSYNKLTGPIPQLKFPTLSVLDLSHNSLQGRIPASLGRCGSLLKMDLSRNHLSGPIPDSISNLKSLNLLDLSHNSLSGPIPNALRGITSLRALILTGNAMHSTIVPNNAFKGLKEITTLVLSDMGLEGPIPESLGEMPRLRVLHLDGNKFNGSIPQSFRRLEKLSELRVDGNRLTGPIPFSKEVVWRMGEKLRVYNNSGLCFDASSGRYEGIASMSGIGYCNGGMESEVGGGGVSSRSTKHLSWSSGHDPEFKSNSSGFAHRCCSLRLLVLITGLLLSCLL